MIQTIAVPRAAASTASGGTKIAINRDRMMADIAMLIHNVDTGTAVRDSEIILNEVPNGPSQLDDFTQE